VLCRESGNGAEYSASRPRISRKGPRRFMLFLLVPACLLCWLQKSPPSLVLTDGLLFASDRGVASAAIEDERPL
jgi:hypothetical protein